MTAKEVRDKYLFSQSKLTYLVKNNKIKFIKIKQNLTHYNEQSIIEYINREKYKSPYKNSSDYHKQHYRKNKKRIIDRKRKFRENNREKARAVANKQRLKNKEKINAWHRKNSKKYYTKKKISNQKWRDNNREKWNAYSKKSKSKPEVRAKCNKYRRDKLKSDIYFMLGIKLRKYIESAFRNGYKTGKAIDLLGCSVPQFKNWLEGKFTNEMCWNNYGTYWHIDHIIPVDAFDLIIDKAKTICFHYSNMQPLEKKKNLSKQNKISVQDLLFLSPETISCLKEKWQKLYYEHKNQQQVA